MTSKKIYKLDLDTNYFVAKDMPYTVMYKLNEQGVKGLTD